MFRRISSFLLLIVVVMGSTPQEANAQVAQPIVYVNGPSGAATPTGANPGNSWANAFKYLPDAIDWADDLVGLFGSTVQIWVRADTYYPDESDASPAPTGSNARGAAFELHSKVEIYGGFSYGDTSLSQRNPETNITILSGDLSQNDTSNFGNRSDNSYHVVTGASLQATARLDGFRIVGGNANGSGDNAQGGGMRLEITSARIIRCVFIDNQATDGGAVFLEGTLDTQHPPFPNKPWFVNCRYLGNKANDEGGAMYNIDAELSVANGVFSGNTAAHGAGYFAADGFGIRTHSDFYDCTFSQNTASSSIGAIQPGAYCGVFNSILWGDSPTEIAGAGTATVDRCTIQGGYSGGTNVVTSDPLFVDADGSNNTPGDLNDDLRLTCSSPAVNLGDTALLPQDVADLDLDASSSDPLPLDVEMAVREIGIVDHGAYEKQKSGCLTDIDADGNVGVSDLLAVISHWGPCASPPPAACVGDVQGPCRHQGNGTVNVQDLLAVISTWGACDDPSPDGMPRTVQDCLNVCAPLGLGTPEYSDCVEKCVSSLP